MFRANPAYGRERPCSGAPVHAVYDLFVVTRSNLSAVAIGLLVVLAAGVALPQEGSPVLDRPFPQGNEGTIPVTLPMVIFLQQSGLSGGIVVIDVCGENTPRLYWKAIQGTIREALNDFQANNPEYRWELRGGALNLVPAAGTPPLLAATIKSFNLQTTDGQTSSALALGMLLKLPEIQQAATALKLKAGLSGGGLGAAWDSSSGKTPPPPPPPRPISVQLTNALPVYRELNGVTRHRAVSKYHVREWPQALVYYRRVKYISSIYGSSYESCA
jgi:hypothetical protein